MKGMKQCLCKENLNVTFLFGNFDDTILVFNQNFEKSKSGERKKNYTRLDWNHSVQAAVLDMMIIK